MEQKEINLDNEEEILKVFNFDYCYNSEQCSRELCMFYNDISKQNNNFNKRQAFVDLGIIAITLNQQDKRIKELEEENKELEIKLDKCGTELVNAESLVSNLEEVQFDYKKENQQLKQQLAENKNDYLLLEEQIENANDWNKDLLKENQQLKLSQNKIAFDALQSVLDKVENIFDDALKNCGCNFSYYDKVLDVIDSQIEELKTNYR